MVRIFTKSWQYYQNSLFPKANLGDSRIVGSAQGLKRLLVNLISIESGDSLKASYFNSTCYLPSSQHWARLIQCEDSRTPVQRSVIVFQTSSDFLHINPTKTLCSQAAFEHYSIQSIWKLLFAVLQWLWFYSWVVDQDNLMGDLLTYRSAVQAQNFK